MIARSAVAVGAILAMSLQASAQDGSITELEILRQRLERQDAEIQSLKERLDAGEGIQPAGHASGNVPPPPHHVPEPPASVVPDGGAWFSPFDLPYYADYDEGFRIRPVDPETHPFELQVNGWIQFRHNAFLSDVDSWTDNAGVTRPLSDRNAFDIERGRLTFSGSALVPELTYFLQLDGDTDGADTVDFFDYWWGYQLTDDLQVQVGKRKVASGRQWLLSARRTRFVDRPMANDFFRPDRTVGVFLVGNYGDDVHYEAMLGNGYQSSNLPISSLDNNFAFAWTAWWEPLGMFGDQIVDYDRTDSPLLQVGHSFTYAPQGALPDGMPSGEADFFRLTDGTKVTDPGAITPGVTVTHFNILLYGVDVAAKWKGWSINAEAFFRWYEDLTGTGPLTQRNIRQHGFYVEGGVFLIPRRLDVNLRYSQIDGEYGHASERAAGFNWYPRDTPRFKISFDVSEIDSSPLNNSASDILVGEDGTLFRTQFQAEF